MIFSSGITRTNQICFIYVHTLCCLKMNLVTLVYSEHTLWQDTVISVLILKGNIIEVVAKVCQSIHISKIALFLEQMFATYIDHLVIYHFTYPLQNKFLKKTVLEQLRSYNSASFCWQVQTSLTMDNSVKKNRYHF